MKFLDKNDDKYAGEYHRRMPLENVSLSLNRGLANIQGHAGRALPRANLSRIKTILLVNPPEATPIKGQYVLPTRYPLNLFTLAGPIVQRFGNIRVVIADLALPNMDLRNILREVQPDLVGVTFMTPQAKMASEIVDVCREEAAGGGKQVVVVGGGVHATAVPHETMEDIGFDYLVLHEEEFRRLGIGREE